MKVLCPDQEVVAENQRIIKQAQEINCSKSIDVALPGIAVRIELVRCVKWTRIVAQLSL